MRKIIVPTDFSETAMNAIRYAVELFKYERSEFIIVNAYADEVYENTREMSQEFFEEYKLSVEIATNKALQKVVADILEISPNPKHKYDYVSKFGSLVDEVNDLVDKIDSDIVIMGTKGKSNKREVTFGSETLQVIKYVKCPVLAVPVGFHGFPPKNILFPTDYMVPFKRRELKLLSTLAARNVTKIKFALISNSEEMSHRQKDNQSFLSCCIEDVQTVFMQIPGTNISETVNRLIAEDSIEMLVMINHRHSYLENILYRSTIEKIGLEISIPFLVLQNISR